MIKPVVDVNETLGDQLIFVGVFPWKDYKTKTVKGSKVCVVCPNRKFEKVYVKIPRRIEEFSSLAINDLVIFENLTADLFVFDSLVLSFKAENCRAA